MVPAMRFSRRDTGNLGDGQGQIVGSENLDIPQSEGQGLTYGIELGLCAYIERIFVMHIFC